VNDKDIYHQFLPSPQSEPDKAGTHIGWEFSCQKRQLSVIPTYQYIPLHIKVNKPHKTPNDLRM
jgi:hypothetical protein